MRGKPVSFRAHASGKKELTGADRIIDFKSYYSKAYLRIYLFSIGLKQVIIINHIGSDKHPDSKIHF